MHEKCVRRAVEWALFFRAVFHHLEATQPKTDPHIEQDSLKVRYEVMRTESRMKAWMNASSFQAS